MYCLTQTFIITIISRLCTNQNSFCHMRCETQQNTCMHTGPNFDRLCSHCQVSHTVEPVLKDHPIGHTNVVSQDRWSLVTGSITLKCRTFCQVQLVFQDRWTLMAVVSHDWFHCTGAVLFADLYPTLPEPCYNSNSFSCWCLTLLLNQPSYPTQQTILFHIFPLLGRNLVLYFNMIMIISTGGRDICIYT